MRGKVFHKRIGLYPTGITPAYAGKSSHLDKSFHGHRDHPRLCGEKLAMLAKLIGKKGITPAYAGKRIIKPSVLDCIKDHPRLCGEKFQHRQFFLVLQGSPPPMRGKAAALDTPQRLARITPAYAGKRIELCHLLFPPPDHPRLCGEKV